VNVLAPICFIRSRNPLTVDLEEAQAKTRLASVPKSTTQPSALVMIISVGLSLARVCRFAAQGKNDTQ
jgi:hypothetical protein